MSETKATISFITLTKGFKAIVDSSMVDFLSQWRFHYTGKGYATSSFTHEGKTYRISMQFIVFHSNISNKQDMHLHCVKDKKEGSKYKVDHKNGNSLDNTRLNLRLGTTQQNNFNVRKKDGGSSKYIGVSVLDKKPWRYWQAQVYFQYKHVFYKTYPFTPEGELAAAKERDIHAKKHFGEFAKLNFPENTN